MAWVKLTKAAKKRREAAAVKAAKARQAMLKRAAAKIRGGATLHGLRGTPEEHAKLGTAAIRAAMKHEGALSSAVRSGDCKGAVRHAADLFYAMGQADAHGALSNAAYTRLWAAGKHIPDACSTQAFGRVPAKRRATKRRG
jgi:hypothetical protein